MSMQGMNIREKNALIMEEVCRKIENMKPLPLMRYHSFVNI